MNNQKCIVSKFYYINMDRSVERREFFLKECEREKIPTELIERFSALDANVYTFSNDELNLFKNCDFLHKNFFLRIVGNQLSHYYILKDIVDKELEYTIVFQDDSVLRNNFMKISLKLNMNESVRNGRLKKTT